MFDEDKELANAVKRDTKKTKQVHLAETRALVQLFGTSDGRALVWWLLRIGRVGSQPYSTSAEATAFNCGELNVGQQILARILEDAPEGYLSLLKEKQNERSATSRVATRDDTDTTDTDA